MKNLLLTASVLGLAMLAAPANAQVSVTVGGSIDVLGGFSNDAGVSNRSGRDFITESEVSVRAHGKADNGLVYGGVIKLDIDAANTGIEESYIYLGNAYGKLEMGDTEGAADKLAVFAPSAGYGQAVGVDEDNRGYSRWLSGGPYIGAKALDSDQATKISYFTPRLQGVQVGVSYAPEVGPGSRGTAIAVQKSPLKDSIEAGANYERTFGDVALKASLGYTHLAGTGALENQTSWQTGAQVGYRGFTVGAGYARVNDLFGMKDIDGSEWNVGAGYEAASYAVAASYTHEDVKKLGALKSYSAYGLGGVYKLAPGVTAGADVVRFERDYKVGKDEEGYVATVGTKLAF